MHFEFEYYEGKRDSWCVARQKRLLPRRWFPQKGRQQSPDYGAPSGAFAFSAPGRLRLDALQGEFDKTYELDLAPARQRFIWIKTVGALNRQQDISLEICCVSGVNVDILPAFQIEEHPILEDLPVGGDGFDGNEVAIPCSGLGRLICNRPIFRGQYGAQLCGFFVARAQMNCVHLFIRLNACTPGASMKYCCSQLVS